MELNYQEVKESLQEAAERIKKAELQSKFWTSFSITFFVMCTMQFVIAAMRITKKGRA